MSDYIDDTEAYLAMTNFFGLSKVEDCITGEMIRTETITRDKISNHTLTSREIACINSPGSNLYNAAATLDGHYIDGTTNAVRTFNTLSLTDYVNIDPSKTYRYKNIYNGYYALYDADLNFISGVGINTPLLSTYPENVRYARFTLLTGHRYTAYITDLESGDPTDYMVISDLSVKEAASIGDGCVTDKKLSDDLKNSLGISSNPCDYTGDEISVFNKCLCIGDSLTSGTMNYTNEQSGTSYVNYEKYSFPKHLEKMTGISVTNMGEGGRTSDEWYNANQSKDLSGYDFAIIQLGVNDAIRYNYEWTENSVNGFTGIINKLKDENTNIFIFVANIIPALSYVRHQALSPYIESFVEGLNDDHVIFLDIAQYGHTADSQAYNCGHLSALGYNRLAQDYKGYISWYIKNNLSIFREVQFIGTEYNY